MHHLARTWDILRVQAFLRQQVRRSGGNIAVDHDLRRAAAEQDFHSLFQFLPPHQEAIVGRALLAANDAEVSRPR